MSIRSGVASRPVATRRRAGWAVTLLASTALVAVPPALAPIGMGHMAKADGGKGGGSQPGAGAGSEATKTGSAGGAGSGGSAGGGGGAGKFGGAGGAGGGRSGAGGGSRGGTGGATAGAAGGAGGDATANDAAGGGGGGAYGYVGDAAPTSDVAGGDGGAGGKGGRPNSAGGGGAGGYGAVLTSSGPYTILHNITGGKGGDGGKDDTSAGWGGDGGYGLLLTQDGVTVTVGDRVTIEGGRGGPLGGGLGQNGVGGVGISGNRLNVTLSPTATVSGGYGGPAFYFRAKALGLGGGGSSLTLQGNGGTSGSTYATINGEVSASGAGNTLAFTGSGGAFGLASINSDIAPLTGQFHGFDKATINSTGTWVMSGDQLGSTGLTWDVAGGTLQLGSSLKSASVLGDMTVESGATLATADTTTSAQCVATISGKLIVQPGATLSLKENYGSNIPALTVHGMDLKEGSTLSFTLTSPSTTAVLKATDTSSYSSTIAIKAGSGFGEGTYGLISFASQPAATDYFTGTSYPDGYTIALSLDPTTRLLSAIVTALPQYWNGSTTTGTTGPVVGGDGTWKNDQSYTNWTNEDGTARQGFNYKKATFAGSAGTVTLEDGMMPISASGLIFKVDGYKIVGKSLGLYPKSGLGQITVDGASTTATIGAALGTMAGIELLGGGTLILTGANTYTSSTTITSGTLQIGDGGTSGSIKGDIANTGKLVFNRSDDLTYAGAVSGTGTLEKKGAGTLTLTGMTDSSTAYTGATTVSAGTLAFAGANSKDSALGGRLTVASGASLSVAPSPNSGKQALTVTDLTFLTGSTLAVTLGKPSDTALIRSTGVVTYNGKVAITAGSNFGEGTYTLVSYVGQPGDGSQVDGGVTGPQGYRYVVSFDNTATTSSRLLLIVSSPDPYWNGSTTTGSTGPVVGGDGTWKSDSTYTNWTYDDGTARVAAKADKTAVFAGTAGTVTVDGNGGSHPVSVAGLTFKVDGYRIVGDTLTLSGSSGKAQIRVDGSSLTATIGAPIATDKIVELLGGGTLVLTGTNTYTGGTTITSGTLQIGDGGTSGSISGGVGNSGKLVFNRSDDVTYAGVVSGSGALDKAGAGTLVLTGVNTFSGATTVRAGTLQVSGNGALTGSVTVQDGAFLAGDPTGASQGTLGGDVSIQNGGTLQAVSGAATLAIGGKLTLAEKAKTALVLGAPSATAAMSVAGDLTLGGALNLTAGTGFASGTYRIFGYGGSLSGAGLTIGEAPDDSLFAIDTATAKQVNLKVAAGQYWNGGAPSPTAPPPAGGTGTWDDTTQNWTDRTGRNPDTLKQGALAIFAGTAGKVTVSDTANPSVAGLSFRTDGYEITGGTIALTGFAGGTTTRISVHDRNVPDGGTATISSTLSGSQTIEKAGRGKLILSGQNSGYTGDVQVSAGTLVAASGHAIGENSSVSVAQDATFVLQGDTTIKKVSGLGSILLDGATLSTGGDNSDNTLAGTLSGSGGLTKKGTGTLTITGQNTYTGPTNVSEGVLDVGGGKVTGDVTVQDKARLAGGDGGSVDGTVHVLDGGTLSGGAEKGLSMGALDVSSKGVVATTLGGPNNTGVFKIKGDVTLGGTLAVTANPGFGLGVYRIADYGGHLTDHGMEVSGLGTGLVGGVQSSITNQVNLIVESSDSPAIAFWNGSNPKATQTVKGGAGTWTNDAGQTNWINASGTIPRAASNTFEVFQGAGGDVRVDGSAGNVAAAGLQFASDGYVLKGDAISLPVSGQATVRVGDGSADGASMRATIASDLVGKGGLQKTDLGTLIFVGSKSYSGGTAVKAGTLQLGDGTSIGSVAGDIANDAALVFAPGSAQTYAGAISGTGSVTKTAAGTLTLSGTHSYTGPTTVAEGRLDVTGSIESSSPLTVHSGATLGGTGRVGAVLVESGGTLAGVQGQTLTTGSLTLSPGSHVSARLGETAGATDLFTVKGDLVLNGALDVDSATGRFGTGLYRVMSYTGALSGQGLSVGTLPRGANVPNLAVQSDTVAKTINLITRPTEASFWNGGKPGAGAVEGGDGTWTADTIWTNAPATNSAKILPGATAIFSGQPGTVRVDAGAGAVSVSGIQFATSGYTVTGDAVSVQDTGLTVRVGDGTREGAAITATISAPLSGAGSLRKTDYGTLVLTGPNTYAGGTSVEGGTVRIGHAKSLGEGVVSLNEGARLAVADDLTLANALIFPQAGDPIIDTGTHTVTMTAPISGVGDLSKEGTGTLVLAGANSYTGATDVVAGTLQVDGSIAASSGVRVESGAALSGSGTVPPLSVLTGGTVAPGSAAGTGTLNVAGSVSFAAGSTYRVRIDPAGHTDAIAATGAATLSGGTVDVQAGTGTYAPGQSYRILSAAGGRTGQFAELRTTTNLAFLQPSLAYDATGVNLGLTRATVSDPHESGGGGTSNPGGTSSGGSATNPGGTNGDGSSNQGGGTAIPGGQNVVRFASVAVTANQRSAANAIEALGSGRLYQGVLSQSAAGARLAFDAASGEVHASVLSAGIEDSRLVREAILGRLHVANSPEVRPDAQAQGQAGTSAGVGGGSVGTPSGLALWGTGFGSFGRMNGDGDAARLKRSVSGFVLGADGRVDAPVFNGWRVGVAGGYTDDTLSVNARSSRGDLKTVFGGAYAGALYGSLDIKLGVLGGGTQATTQRTVLFPGFMDTAHARSDGRIVQGFGELGYRFGITGGFVEPVVQAAAIRLSQDGMRETGGSAALRVLKRTSEVQTTTLGARGELLLSDKVPFVARAFVGWRHAFGDVAPQSLAAFGGSSNVFKASGAPIDGNAVVTEIGLGYLASDALSLSVNYTAQAGARAVDQGVKGQIDLRF